ncbi:hypothetical protein HHK36_029883 [Tetracentron sinense]|uniref:Uncharacterized protein n=1 Tax=Tetracentron sinense TaxID=13715 RepID=A0A834YG25_TETSI|nr:hypothetical protein HHK36_029883 [Tetracentron sinense]
MKFDNESIYGHSTLAHKPDSISFECNDNAMETAGLKASNEVTGEDQIRITCYLKIHNNDMDPDPLPAEMDNGDGVGKVQGLHGSMVIEDLTNGRENETGDSVTPYINPFGEVELSEKEMGFYTDKSVAECDLSELIICFEEGSYHLVKDICIDEGMLSLENNFVENGEGDHKGLCSSLPSDVDENSDLTQEMEGIASNILDGMKSSVENDHKKDVSDHCVSDNMMQKGEGNLDASDKIANDVPYKEEVMPENMLLVRELDTENSHPDSSTFNGDEGERQSHQDPSKEAILENTAVASAADDLNCTSMTNEVPFNSKVESGSITFDFDFDSTLAISGSEESSQNADFKPPPESPNMSGLEDGTLDSLTASSRSFFIQHGHEESSFSAVGPLSGPIPYSGSISLRSDSSTTSTRSFAFPILPSEWNASPVKMSKADRRHFRKHGGWRQGLLCCRF